MRTPAVQTDNYEQIIALHSDGKTMSEISDMLGIFIEEVRHNICWFIHDESRGEE